MATAKEIKAARTALDETQSDFGKRFLVDQATIHRWETKGPPRVGLAAVEIDRRLAELKNGARKKN